LNIKEKKLVICRIDVEGELKANKPLHFPHLDWSEDLKLSVIGPKDVKIL
jgi:hypothetical protein